MKKLACALVLLTSVSSFAQKESAEARKQVTEYFRLLASSIEQGNMKAIESLLDPSYTSVDLNGKHMNLAQCKVMWAEGMSMMKNMKVSFNVKNVQLQKMEASVWYEMKMSGVIGTGKEAQKVSFTTRHCDTLVNKNGWKAVYSMELPTNEPWSFKTEGGGR
ncbi:MAG TPA: hypothetical protein PKA27_09600 [Fimbriimonadaceae bacterium]|mgnify:CR=1 FL=1|nr:hypothetical protein [Fimbriimonadaceae bacterium]